MARWSLKGVAPLIMLIGAACAAPGDAERQSGIGNNSVRFFSEAYEHIVDHYVQQVDMRRLVVDGLGALSEIDGQVSFRASEGRIAVARGNEVRSELPLPAGNDPDAWANFTVDSITAARVVSPALEQASAEDIYEKIMDSMVDRLDTYSRYSTAAEARDIRALREGYTGIGISVRMAEPGIEIVRVYRGTPAERSGLRRNDHIVGIEGQPIAPDAELRDIVNRLRGPVGSDVRITIRREGREPFEVRVERERVTPIMVQYRREGDIAYISVERFTARTGSHVENLVRRARNEIGPSLKGYILDLRDNPGGLLFESIRVSNLFLDQGRIVFTRGRHPDSEQDYYARVGDIARGKPIVILINGRSASASEIVAGALQDHGRAIVVGSNSFGKGTVQSEIDLPNTGALSITWSRFHTPAGYALQGLGILPNVCTSRSGQTPARITARLSHGQSLTGPYFQRWRTTPVENEEARSELRGVCPATTDTGREADDAALSIARRILENQQLYSVARNQSRPFVASSANGQHGALPGSDRHPAAARGVRR